MDKQLMDLLCCPVCKKDLELEISAQKEDEIIEGNLYCKTCNFYYPINEGIPNLLPPEYHEK
jgi:uncharacterized protein YbaR (Trm112 family)